MFLSIKKKLPYKVLIIGLILIILISNYFSKNPIKFGKNELNESISLIVDGQTFNITKSACLEQLLKVCTSFDFRYLFFILI